MLIANLHEKKLKNILDQNYMISKIINLLKNL